MKIRLLVMFAAVGALAAPSTMGAGTVLLSEDFEGYVIGSNLAGQGGWFQPNPMSVDPMLISNGTGLASKVANGHIMAGSNSTLSHSPERC